MVEVRKSSFNREILSTGQPVHIHLGDATAFAALTSLKEPNTSAIIIDPNVRATQGVIDSLASGKSAFEFLENDPELQRVLSSIYVSMKERTKYYRNLDKAYRTLWHAVKGNIGNLHLVEGRIQDVLKNLDDKIPAADFVSYYYPSPRYNPQFAALQLASKLLKSEGEFTVASEVREIVANFVNWGGSFAEPAKYVFRDNNPYLSAYDYIFGNHGYYQTTICNREDGLEQAVKKKKRQFGFIVQGMLGMIQ